MFIINKYRWLRFFVVFIVISWVGKAWSLPVYTNYQTTDIINIKLQDGYVKGAGEFKDINIVNNVYGINFKLSTNLFYNTPYLHKVYLGVNSFLLAGTYLNQQIVLANAEYSIPVSNTNFYIDLNAGVGTLWYKFHSDTNIINLNIQKPKNVVNLGLGVSYFLKKVGYTRLGIYSNLSYTVINYQDNILPTSISCKAYFLSVGLIYKISYLT